MNGMMVQSRAALAPDVLPLKYNFNFVRRIEKVCTSMFMCASYVVCEACVVRACVV